MKKQRKLFVTTILLFAVLCYNGFHVYSDINTHSYSIENSANMNNSLISDIDSIGDDQIIFSTEYNLNTEPTYLMFIPASLYIIYKHYFSIWQPPEN